MEQIKTTTETIITYGNDTWENLGDVTLYSREACGYMTSEGFVTLLYKSIPGLGKRFKVIYKDKIYAIEKNTNPHCKDRYNARIVSLNFYLNIEGYE